MKRGKKYLENAKLVDRTQVYELADALDLAMEVGTSKAVNIVMMGALSNYLELRNTIIPLQGSEDALFLSLQNKRMSVRAMENMVSKYTSKLNTLKHITPHKLRSTFGTNLYRETNDIYLVADFLGHKDVNTTRKHYASISDDTRRKAIMNFKLREDENDISANNDSKKNDED